MQSSWSDDSQTYNRRDNHREGVGDQMVDLSLTEWQMILRVRMLEAGKYNIAIEKDKRGMRGLVEFLVSAGIDNVAIV